MRIYAIVPARSGSKGIPDKNIKKLAGVPLLAYSVAFARQLGVDQVICSTDSSVYAEIAREYGASVPFLRSAAAAADTAMEEDILLDLERSFEKHHISIPDIYVWLRPTFIFRCLNSVNRCITALIENITLTAVRTVVPAESRLYYAEQDLLHPIFDDKGRSMCRRQDTKTCFKVYSTDVFRGNLSEPLDDFLGRSVGYVEIPKICGMDIDDQCDWMLVESLLNSSRSAVAPYLHLT